MTTQEVGNLLSTTLLVAGAGHAAYSASQGDYSGLVSLGFSIGLASAFAGNTSPQEPRAGGSTPEGAANVDVYYNDVEGFPPGDIHTYGVIRDPDVGDWYFGAFPEGAPETLIGKVVNGSAAAAGQSSEWGNLHAHSLPVDEAVGSGIRDTLRNPAAHQRFVVPKSPSVVRREITSFALKVNRASVSYDPFSRNSNSFTFSALERVLGSRPSPATWRAIGSGGTLGIQ